MRAVRFERYGGPEVLEVVEVEEPTANPGQVLVRVKAAGINPGEAAIREGRLQELWPATFPSGEGSDLAGVVEEAAAGVDGWGPGAEVIGWSEERASHAELVAVPPDHLTTRPPEVPWEVAGALYVAGATAWAAVRAVAPQPGETVAVSAAAGGVGCLAVQLARRAGARVVGIAGEAHHEWLRRHGVVPVAYGDGLAERLREEAAEGIDAFIDTFGGGYADLAIELGVPVERINTIADFAAVERLGVNAQGTGTVASSDVVREIAGLVADGSLEIPIAKTYPLAQVREAYVDLAARRTHGKIVLLP
jgi:NADPH:quinone reductase-like Zn-dependent oxidoreductase